MITEVELSEVFIEELLIRSTTAAQVVFDVGGFPRKVEIKTTEFSETGEKGAESTVGWDLTANSPL